MSSVTVDFLNTAAHIALFFFAMRLLQMKLQANHPDSDFGKALAFLFH